MSASSSGQGVPSLKRQTSKLSVNLDPSKKKKIDSKPGKPTPTNNNRSKNCNSTPTLNNVHTSMSGTRKQTNTLSGTGTNIVIPNVVTHNGFDNLPVDESDDNMSVTNDTSISLQKKPPPIVIVGSSPSAIQNLMNSCVPSKKFQLKLMKIGIRVNFLDFKDYEAAHAELLKQNIGFFQYHTAATRPVKVVLYGLCDVPESQILEELASVNVIPQQVKKLRIRQPNYHQQAIYLLYFLPGTTRISDLRKIKHINNIIVRWERFHPKDYDKVAQCRNCLNYGHSSVNCNLPPRCTLCAKNHSTMDCSMKKSRAELLEMAVNKQQVDRSFIKCALCGEQHTASYKGCAMRKEYLKMQENRNSKNVRRKVNINLNDDLEFPPIPPIKDRNNTRGHGAWGNTSDSATTEMMQSMLNTMQSLMDGMREMMGQMSQMMTVVVQRLAPVP